MVLLKKRMGEKKQLRGGGEQLLGFSLFKNHRWGNLLFIILFYIIVVKSALSIS